MSRSRVQPCFRPLAVIPGRTLMLRLALLVATVPGCGPAGARNGQPVAAQAPPSTSNSPGTTPAVAEDDIEAGGESPGSPAPASAPGSKTAATDGDLLERIEKRVTEAIARVRESALALEYSGAEGPKGARRIASGVVISGDGDVLSVRVDPPPSADLPIVARDVSGRRTTASWVAADPETGLTLLKVAAGVARPATPSVRGPRLGLHILVIGNPFGLGHSVSRGAVSGLNRRLELGPKQLGGLFQIDAAIHPGDSGALVADLHGDWIGVVRSGLATPVVDRDPAAEPQKDKDRDKEKDKDGDGDPTPPTGRDRDREHDHDLGFAVTASDALWVAGQLREHGRVDRAYLGVAMSLLAPSEPTSSDAGVLIGRVVSDTPADRAGLKAGDRIVALDGQPIRSPNDLTDHLDRTAAGTDVAVEFCRGDPPNRQCQTQTVRTALRPTPPASSSSSPDKDKEKEKDKAESGPPKRSPTKPKAWREPALPREAAERIDRLEHRVKELEHELHDRRASDVTGKP